MATVPRSDVMAANFRGLDAPDEPEDGKFVYTNCLDRAYENTQKIVARIEFDISRYGEYQHCITFDPKVTEQEAIIEVEKYLSEPITKEYFNKIRDDMFDRDLTWTDVEKEGWPVCRGDAMTDKKFLERITIDSTGNMTMFIGS
jgi:hypothetical protein